MIILYDSKTVNFNNNGLGVLSDVISCEVMEERNGLFELELEYPFDLREKWRNLIEDNIIKAPTPTGEQLFRIYRKYKSMSGIRVFARHIFYDLIDNFLEDCRPENTDGTGALSRVLSSTQYTHNFTSISDVPGPKTAYFIRKNPVEAIFSEDGVLGRWGGELERDNFLIKLLQSRGKDRGVTIRYGKNLLGIEEDLKLDSVITRIMPQGYDGLFLPEKYIDSPFINNYPHPKIRKIEYSDVKIDEENGITEAMAIAQLRERALQEFSVNKVDIPAANYKVDFIELSKTEEYKNYVVLEKVYLCDTVTIKHLKLGFDLKAKVIKYKYNCLTNRYTEIELGAFKESMISAINTLTSLKDTVSNLLQNAVTGTKMQMAIDHATELLTGALGGHVVFRPKDKPVEILIMDTDNIMTAQQVWRWGLNGLGYSNTGVNGPYETAMTMDGYILGKFIAAHSITTNQVSSDFGQNLDLSSNTSITSKVSNDDLEQRLTVVTPHHIILSNENQSFPTDSAGKNITEITITAKVDTYKGSQRIAATIGTLALKNASGAVITGATLSKVNPTASTSGNVTMTIAINTTISADNGYVEIPITIENNSYTKLLTWSKSKTGPQGVNGTNGTNGSDGSPAKLVDITTNAQYFTTNSTGTDPSAFVYAPTNIILTPTFQSTTYSKWEYSLDGSVWVAITTQGGMSINATTKALTIPSTCSLFTTTQFYIIFKITTTTGETDLMTISRVTNTINTEVRLKTAEEKITEDAIIQTVSSTIKSNVNNAVNNVKVGVRNLLKNTNLQITTSNYNIKDYNMTEAIDDGTQVTVSMKATLGAGKTYFGLYNSGGSIQVTQLTSADLGSDGVYRKTFNWTIGGSANTFLRVYHMLSSTVVNSTITWIKLEYGNKASDYSEAPEDVEARINSVGNAANTAQSKANEVEGKLAGKANTADLTVLETNITKQYTEMKTTVDGVGIDVGLISKKVNAQGEELTMVNTYFDFTATGLRIGKSDSPLQITIDNQSMQFLDTAKNSQDTFVKDPQAVAYINGKKMYIDSLEVLSSLLVGVHKIEKYDANTTLIRWVGGN